MVVPVFLMIGKTMRLSIFSRCDTINVMKLIGATDGFILRPFLNGRVRLGFISALLLLVLSGMLMWRLESIVSDVAKILALPCATRAGWDEALLLLINLHDERLVRSLFGDGATFTYSKIFVILLFRCSKRSCGGRVSLKRS